MDSRKFAPDEGYGKGGGGPVTARTKEQGMRFIGSAPEEGYGKGGGGPDDDFRFPERTLRSHGLVSMVFGFALGITLVIFFLLFHWLGAPPVSGLDTLVGNLHPNVWYVFLLGFAAGTLLAAVYNFLLFRRLNVLGLDRETY